MISLSRMAVPFVLALLLSAPAFGQESLSIGANVNMVTGGEFPNGDPFLRQQNEPSVAFSSRNNLHLLAGANDYRAVDVPGLPGGRETGDSWLSYFWSTNGGATWKSTLIPGYPQDPACLGPNPPVLCDYAAGADPVVRAGANGMFYYSGIVFERTDPSRSAIFVSRFIDLNNDTGGEPIRYLDTTIIDANNDGSVFLDKSWIGVDIPRASAGPIVTDTLSVVQRDDTLVEQTVQCGNIYVGYAAIGGEGQDLRSEIRLATSTDCGNTWGIQPISQPDSLNQGANIAIHPLNGDVHVVWRRFDTVESFLGISPIGCPASPSSWEVNDSWPVDSIVLAGSMYTREEAQALLAKKHRGDESIKLAYEVIAAKLNLLTGGGDPVPGFNSYEWTQELTGYIEDAEAWFIDNPIESDPKQGAKKDGQNIKKSIQRILQGSGSCAESGGGAVTTMTGETNAIMAVSSDDFGATFSEPVVIDESSTFDQGSTRFSFRTTAYPTVATDTNGRVYVAWAARGFANIRDQQSDGDARIVISTSGDGTTWSTPYAIDEPNREGHQIKPSLLFAGGQLTMVFYDFREDVSGVFEGFVIDLPDPERLRHTVDVRVARALPAPAPAFTDYSLLPEKTSDSASRYSFLTTDTQTLQVEYMVPNFPMFADGTTPFIGDYVDIAAPNLILDNGTWRFASNPGDVQVWQAVWSDNRDVIPPPDGDWSKYVAPITEARPSFFDPTVTIPSCSEVTFPDALPQFQAGALYTGTRNQNVYSASISNGVIVAAPGNNRPLGTDTSGAPLERGFVVYVQNTTAETRDFRVTLAGTPDGIRASLAQDEALSQKDIEIQPYSSAVVTVFAALDFGTSQPIPVSVVELGGSLGGSVLLNSDPGAPDPLINSLLTTETHNPAILNPAILNPAILNASVDTNSAEFMTCTEDPAKCVLNPAILNPAVFNPAILNPAILNTAIFNPAILNPAIFNPAILNPAILNPAILNPAIFNPAILNPAILNPAILNPAILNPAILNPAILNPAVLNPAILNPAVLNPAILNPAILNPAILNSTPEAEAQQVDVTFAVRNEGNATTAYDLNLAAEQIEGLDYELLVYRLNETLVPNSENGCLLTTQAQQQLILNESDPLNKANDGSFYLEPGEEVLVTFRVVPDVEAETPLDPVTEFEPDDLGGLVSSQPLNTNPLSQPPADEFGPPANIIPATAGGDFNGSGTPPVNAGPLAAGQQVSITATGVVERDLGGLFPPNSPNGSGPCPANCLLPGAPALSLVARIDGGPWQFVGEGPTTLTATTAGDLEFGVNDNGYSDNSGAFFVSVTPVENCPFAGDWAGPFLQGATTYDLSVTNLVCGAPGSVIAEVEYPSLNCNGTWTLDGVMGDTLMVTESLSSGGNCQTGWQYDVTLVGDVLNGVSTNFSGTFALPRTIASNFVADADDWTIQNDVGGWVAAGGNPLGYLSGQDSGGATGSTAWYFSAPDKFLGNQLEVYGGELRYDLEQSDNAPTLVDLPWVILRGNGVTLVYDAGANALPGINWTSYSVPLDAAAPGWYIADDACWLFSIVSLDVCNFGGAVPSQAQFESVLGNLDTLLIRGEYSLTLDSGGLDNVQLYKKMAFREIVLQNDTDIANSGVLVVANDLGISPGAVTVNGVTFGTDQSGQAPGEWLVSDDNTFLNESLSPELDNLLDDLVFVNFGRANVDSTFSIGGLTPGNDYRLQMLFSNDLNSGGNNVEVTVEGETWLLDGWIPDPINLSVEFTASGPSADIVFTGGPGSTSESGRAVLNAYAVHDLTVQGPQPGTVWRADFDFTGVTPDGPYACIRQQWLFNETLGVNDTFRIDYFDVEGGPVIGSRNYDLPIPVTNLGDEVLLSGTALTDGIGYAIMTFSRPFNLDSLELFGYVSACFSNQQTPFVPTTLTVDP